MNSYITCLLLFTDSAWELLEIPQIKLIQHLENTNQTSNITAYYVPLIFKLNFSTWVIWSNWLKVNVKTDKRTRTDLPEDLEF